MEEPNQIAPPTALPCGGKPWIVAVGASAGGLEALQRFFAGIKLPSNASYVVLQHLAPDHRSLMAELLTPHCALPVLEAIDGQPLEPDHVYLMPAGVLMTIKDDRLVFEPRPPRGLALPIDLFLKSMSQHQPERCIGIVLSGSGSDGSVGAAALRESGGYVMAQAPETALFDSMPKSVINSTSVDSVLPPEGLATQALALSQGRAGRLHAIGLIAAPSAKSALQRLFACLLEHCGVDFGHYKLPTVMRRIERRMQVAACESLNDYAELVEHSVEEAEALRRELLIPVTSFFREPEAFAYVGSVLENLIKDWPDGRSLRIWSAGCATGEEAYSLAMLAMEACAAVKRWPTIQVFATDTDQQVLDIASLGVYPDTAAEGINPERVSQFFTRSGNQLVVKPELRRQILFARHNLLDDPPFTKIDLVVCRNTLIYLQVPAQERVMRRLQYALNAQGYLFLGSSESLGSVQNDFRVMHSGHKIYQLAMPVKPRIMRSDNFSRSLTSIPSHRVERHTHEDHSKKLVEIAQRRILQTLSPLCLLVTAQRKLLHAWGPTQKFLRLQDGSPQLDAIHLLPERIGALAGHAFHVALNEQREVYEPPVQLDLEGIGISVRVKASPIRTSDLPETCVLLAVEELGVQTVFAPTTDLDAPLSEAELTRLTALEHELTETRLTLQTTIEDLEASNEELQATNEELMSSNEELQSTNEELQSVNEELHTVNSEYNGKLEALSALNADLDGMSQATGIATIFVDQQLQLLRFTPEAAVLFRFRQTDLGRPISDFNNPLDYKNFIPNLQNVLKGGGPVEQESFSETGHPYVVRILGYSESASTPQRAVISLIDVSRLRDAQRLQAVIDSLSCHVAVLDKHGTIVQVNQAWSDFGEHNGASDTSGVGVGANYLAVLARSPGPDGTTVLKGLQEVLNGEATQYQVTYPCHSDTENRWFVMHASELKAQSGGAVVTHYDITRWHAVLQKGIPPLSSGSN